MKRFAILVVLFLAAAFVPGGCSRPRESGVVQMKGSDTMVNLGQAWVETYSKEHPKANITVTGGGSGTGIAALINGDANIAQASREMKPE